MMKICIYGCGKIGKEAVKYFENKKAVKIFCLCDSDFKKWGGDADGKLKIVSPEKLAEQADKLDYIVIATIYFDEIIANLNKLGIGIEKMRVYKDCDNPFRKIEGIYKNRSWSQDGEDIYLQEKFGNKKGFYVDVGALHPFRFSNTAWAYEKGWSGINIEPNVDCFQLFEALRPRDININCGISDIEKEMTYYCFAEPALNGFDVDVHSEMAVIEKRIIKCRTLSEIFKEHEVKQIDFLDIDVEGFEMSVLHSIDFSVDIACILLEQHVSVDMLDQTAEYCFLKEKGFSAVAKYGRTTIYEREC